MKSVNKETLTERIESLQLAQECVGLSMNEEYMLIAYRMLLSTMDSELEERYQQLSDLYHAQEKRLFKIARRIKGPTFDKYSHSPSQAIDVLEAAIFGEDDTCRATMLNQK